MVLIAKNADRLFFAVTTAPSPWEERLLTSHHIGILQIAPVGTIDRYQRLIAGLIKQEMIMGSTTDKITGKANELAGQARQGLGKAVGNDEMQAKGLVQEAKGDAQQAKGDAKAAIKNVVDKA
jgi:uncharacterized protein YjbJ (UPF0337 family)